MSDLVSDPVPAKRRSSSSSPAAGPAIVAVAVGVAVRLGVIEFIDQLAPGGDPR
jgi:hypothetical protein